MELNFKKEGQRWVASLMGRLDAVSAPEFDRRIQAQMETGEISFVVDLQGLDYISSAGLRSMLTLAKSLKIKGGSLVLCGLRDVVKEVFEVSGFTTIFAIRQSLEEALRS